MYKGEFCLLNISVMETKGYQWPEISSLFYEKVPGYSLRHCKEKCQTMSRNSVSIIQVQVMMIMIKHKYLVAS